MRGEDLKGRFSREVAGCDGGSIGRRGWEDGGLETAGVFLSLSQAVKGGRGVVGGGFRGK